MCNRRSQGLFNVKLRYALYKTSTLIAVDPDANAAVRVSLWFMKKKIEVSKILFFQVLDIMEGINLHFSGVECGAPYPLNSCLTCVTYFDICVYI